MPVRVFRRPNRWVPKQFDEWREIHDDGNVVTVFFGTSETWPPAVRKRSESRPLPFDDECAATLARGFVEVGANGQQVNAAPNDPMRELDAERDPYARFTKLRKHLVTTADPTATVTRLRATLAEIERDLDEHDRPFPGPNDRPADHGAVRAYAAHFRRLAERLGRGEALTPAERAYEYTPSE